MNLTVSHTFVIVDDQDKALIFYRDVLGLQLRVDAPLGDMRWLTVGPESQPELEIGLILAEMGRSPEDARALSELLAKGALGSLIFKTDDCVRDLRTDPSRRGGGPAGTDRPALRRA